ncbi:MAG: translation elongation factor-like protein [Candidatus Altiarchaeales archaeon WOR_SM1_79]|nr:MAG: translation elongation factor-like protein [Candidatus Altiarchaeales archaeon WOR_SM1_79]
MEEKKVGEVIKFFGKIGVAAIKLTDDSLRVGDTIHIKGHTTDLTQQVGSMQIENQNVQEAGPGADIGVKVGDRVRENDVVYKVIE